MSKPWLQFYDKQVPTELTVPHLTLPESLTNAAKNHPKQTALVYLGARIQYRQLKNEVDGLAAALYALSVKPGYRVGIMMPNCPQAVIAYYATLSLGAMTVMTNPLYVERELEHQWRDAGVEIGRLLLGQSDDLPDKPQFFRAIHVPPPEGNLPYSKHNLLT